MMVETSEAIKVARAMDRAAAWIDAMNAKYCPPDACCATCALGSEFTDACEAQERRAKWLVVLLRKRGMGDLADKVDEDIKWDFMTNYEQWVAEAERSKGCER
jgi:tellurite resistance protein